MNFSKKFLQLGLAGFLALGSFACGGGGDDETTSQGFGQGGSLNDGTTTGGGTGGGSSSDITATITNPCSTQTNKSSNSYPMPIIFTNALQGLIGCEDTKYYIHYTKDAGGTWNQLDVGVLDSDELRIHDFAQDKNGNILICGQDPTNDVSLYRYTPSSGDISSGTVSVLLQFDMDTVEGNQVTNFTCGEVVAFENTILVVNNQSNEAYYSLDNGITWHNHYDTNDTNPFETTTGGDISDFPTQVQRVLIDSDGIIYAIGGTESGETDDFSKGIYFYSSSVNTTDLQFDYTLMYPEKIRAGFDEIVSETSQMKGLAFFDNGVDSVLMASSGGYNSGDQGWISKSSDGGKTWATVLVTEPASSTQLNEILADIACNEDGSLCISVGYREPDSIFGGVIYATIDEGTTWYEIQGAWNTKGEDYWLREIEYNSHSGLFYATSYNKIVGIDAEALISAIEDAAN